MNNSTFGKTMENLISQKIFSKNVAVIHEIKLVLSLDKPNYVGFSILDLSKLLM